METKHYKKGEIIFREGSIGNTMYEINSGSVGIFVLCGEADEQKLTELGAGRIFGEMSVIEVYPRSATAIALEDVEVTEVSTADIRQYFEDRPEKLLEIMRALSRRLRELTDDYDEACTALTQWRDDTKQGGQKRSGLMALLERFAEAYAHSVRHVGCYPLSRYGRFYY